MGKIKGVAPHKAPPIIRWVGAYGYKDFPLKEQFKYEFLQSYGKSAEAMKHQHRSNPDLWYSYLGLQTGLGLVVDISATPLHRCYAGDVQTSRGYDNKKGVPLCYFMRPSTYESVQYVTKYSQIWNGISRTELTRHEYDEAVVGNGKNPVRYQAIVYRKDRKIEAEFFASITGLPLFEVVGDDGSVDLEPVGFDINTYFPR